MSTQDMLHSVDLQKLLDDGRPKSVTSTSAKDMSFTIKTRQQELFLPRTDRKFLLVGIRI